LIELKNKDELDVVFHAYYKALVNYASNFSINLDEREDIVQDIFVYLWKQQLEFPNEAALKAYLYTTVRNRCLNVIKHNKVKSDFQISQNIDPVEDSLFQKQVLEEEITRQLYKIINTLKGRKREIILLSLKGMKGPEIATKLKIEAQTVRAIRTQAYKIIKEKINALGYFLNFVLTYR